ncbi:MAG: DUF177 domain-containing protein [Thermomicrobiales bacterium]|nr:DUF177 domain-containing protein [Thermomicrobiales bacterium]
MELRNETAINVAGLLRTMTGGSRTYELHLDAFPLGDGLIARDVEGEVRLTRLRDAVIAAVRVAGRVPLECVRCLRIYDQSFATEYSEEYRQTVDLRSGAELEPKSDEDEDTALIDENHELDLAETLRQEILVALPMRPDCGEICPGPGSLRPDLVETDEGDARLAALAQLLGEDSVDEEKLERDGSGG